MVQTALYKSAISSLQLINSGKVRDIYNVDNDHMLIVTTDRLSAFDVILPDPIPGKGAVLTALSNFWFARTRSVIANHLTEVRLSDVLPVPAEREPIEGR
ncbi:MAG: phosphoribosylaminoimidazole-succinocarboxamide synthase, partial [Gammaproteobacteria bacterium]|nr:phosphoribosylaminoimidazole-succinocarboxamide synthase [Gammaproteobacteria bacterium]